MQQICRACLLKLEENNENAMMYKSVFTDLTSIQIKDNDRLPKTLCDGCVCKLLYFKEFKELCSKSHEYLKSQLHDSDEQYHFEEIVIEHLNTKHEQPESLELSILSTQTANNEKYKIKSTITKRMHCCSEEDCNESFGTVTRLHAHQNIHQNVTIDKNLQAAIRVTKKQANKRKAEESDESTQNKRQIDNDSVTIDRPSKQVKIENTADNDDATNKAASTENSVKCKTDLLCFRKGSNSRQKKGNATKCQKYTKSETMESHSATQNKTQWTKETLMAAKTDIETGMSIRKTAFKHGIPISTLQMRVKQNDFETTSMGRKSALGPAVEATLVQKIQELGCPITRKEIRIMARDIANKMKLNPRYNTQIFGAGRKWLCNFLRRNSEISVTSTESRNKSDLMVDEAVTDDESNDMTDNAEYEEGDDVKIDVVDEESEDLRDDAVKIGEKNLELHNIQSDNQSTQQNKVVSPIACHLCGQTFKATSSLYAHCRSIHKMDAKEIERIVSVDKEFNKQTTGQMTSSTQEPQNKELGKKDSPGSAKKTLKRKNKYRCSFKGCKAILSSFQTLENHENRHVKTKNAIVQPPALLWSNQCNVCRIRLEDADTFKRHLKSHEKDEYVVAVCDICQRPIKDPGTLLRHKRTHRPKEEHMVECSVCGKNVNKRSLNEHIYWTHSEIENVVCHICGKSMKPRALKLHQRNHESGEFQCPKCPRVFSTTVKRWVHHSTAHRKNSLKVSCTVCGKTFSRNTLLRKHCVNVHTAYSTTENIFACKVCDVKCKTPDILSRHEKVVHGGERKYACSLCPKAFTLPAILKHHMYSHTGERPVHCEICNKGLYNNYALKIHMNIHKRQWIAEGVQGIELQKYSKTQKKPVKNDTDDDFEDNFESGHQQFSF